MHIIAIIILEIVVNLHIFVKKSMRQSEIIKPKDVNELIKELRKLKGLTQGRMAEQLEITQSTYGKIERGEVDISISKLFKIFKAINIEPVSFFAGLCNPGSGVFTYDEVLISELDDFKSKVERQEAEIKYLNSQIEIRDRQKEMMQHDINFLTDNLESYEKKGKKRDNNPPF